MPNLIPFDQSNTFNGLTRPRSRELARTLGSLQAGLRMETARIEAAAEVQALKADAVTFVGKRAMQDVAMLSQLEQQLATLVPMATGRLQGIADMTSLAIAEVVGDTLRRVR
jgi:hypothetical protein